MTHINKVHIQLGTSCNLNCIYCVQNATLCKDSICNDINADIYDFIVKTYTSNKELCEDPFRVHFYGGEPLLYFDKIVTIHKNLINAGYTGYFGVTTNGKLLTDDIVSYFNSNNFKVSISWDGRYSDSTRGYNVISDKIDTIVHINNLRINVAISKNTPISDVLADVTEFSTYYHSKTGRNLSSNTFIVQNSGDVYNECFDFDDKLFEYDAYNTLKVSDKNSMEYKFYEHIADDVGDPYEFAMYRPYCDREQSISMDTLGNILYCCNSGDVLCNIYDKDIYNNIVLSHIKNSECKECCALSFCRFGCPLMTDVQRRSYCAMKKAIVSGVRKFYAEGS